jgi:hypothetical protein
VDKHQLYVVTLCSLLLVTVVALSAANEQRLEVYVSLFTVTYLATSALFRPRRRLRDIVGASLFIVFGYIVATKVTEILL